MWMVQLLHNINFTVHFEQIHSVQLGFVNYLNSYLKKEWCTSWLTTTKAMTSIPTPLTFWAWNGSRHQSYYRKLTVLSVGAKRRIVHCTIGEIFCVLRTQFTTNSLQIHPTESVLFNWEEFFRRDKVEWTGKIDADGSIGEPLTFDLPRRTRAGRVWGCYTHSWIFSRSLFSQIANHPNVFFRD